MGNSFKLVGLAVLGAASLAGTVQAAPVLITGTLRFASDPTNYFDPAQGYVPATTSNAAGITVPITGNVEFGFKDSANIDFADFTGTSLSINDVTLAGASDFVMTFAANRSHFFDNAVLAPNTFGGSISVNGNGNILTFTSPNVIASGFAIRAASITFLGVAAPVPEAATWAMMITGFGLVGGAMRRGRKVAPRLAYA